MKRISQVQIRCLLRAIGQGLKAVCIGLFFGGLITVICFDTYLLLNIVSVVVDMDDQLTLQNILWYRITTAGKTQEIDTTILDSSVMVLSNTRCARGSGTVCKVGDNLYVLTCAHLFETQKDEAEVVWNRGKSEVHKEVEIIALDTKLDLALLKAKKPLAKTTKYVSISVESPDGNTAVDIVGNPGRFSNLATFGRIKGEDTDGWVLTNPAAKGSSGGGVFYEGALCGVTIAVSNWDNTTCAVPLYKIRAFLLRAIPDDYAIEFPTDIIFYAVEEKDTPNEVPNE